MRLEEELYIAQTAEAELAGTLSAEQRKELETRLAADPSFAQAYKEYYHTISSLFEGGQRKRYKMMLQDLHEEVTAKKQGMKRLIIHFNPKHIRTAAVAATVALLTSAITVFTIRHNEPKVTPQTLQLVRHDVDRLKAKTQKMEGDIHELAVKDNSEETTLPPQSNYTGTGFALANDGYIVTNYHVSIAK